MIWPRRSRSAADPGPFATEDPAAGPLFSLNNLEKYFNTPAGRSYVLRQVSLSVEPGEFVTIMGPSGAGKSTLLSILGMFDSDWEGEFYFQGHPVHRLAVRDRIALNKRAIGFVFQQYHLLDDLTIAENLDVPLSYRDVRKSDREAIVADMLDRFSIVGKKDLYPRQLSGGQQQLVGIARAIVASPALILADEPTGNLHSAQAREIMELFRQLNEQGTTIVQVTHSEENAGYGSRTVQLRDGWVVSDEPVG